MDEAPEFLRYEHVSICLENWELGSVHFLQQINASELGLFYIWGNECRMLKRGIDNWVCFATGLVVQSKVCFVLFRQRDIVQYKIKNKNLHFSYLSSLHGPKFQNNVNCNTLHSSCDTTVHLLWSTFQLMFTVTHSIQAAIPLSTCCEVPSN